MNQSVRKWLLAIEVVLCFAIPTYFLFWGVLALPLWLMGQPATYAIIHALCTVGGFLGLAAVIRVLYYVLASDARPLNWYIVMPFLLVGLISIWTEMTGQFAGFSLNPFWLFMVLGPTICTAQLAWLAGRKSRDMPNKAMHATCEDARA